MLGPGGLCQGCGQSLSLVPPKLLAMQNSWLYSVCRHGTLAGVPFPIALPSNPSEDRRGGLFLSSVAQPSHVGEPGRQSRLLWDCGFFLAHTGYIYYEF